MAETINEVIIDVQVNAGESAKNLADVKQKIADLKKEQKTLQDFIRSGADTTGELSARYAENAANLKQLNAEEKMYTAQLNVATQENRQYGDSLTEQAALLTQLKNEYRGLSKEQRESAGGQELLQQIQTLDTSLKDADASMGDFQRNVGNYQSALEGLGGNVGRVAMMFQGGFKQALAAAGTAVKNFGKMLLTTPVGWIAAAIAAIIAVFNKLREGFKLNDEAGTRLQAALQRFRPILDVVTKAFVGLANGVSKVVDLVSKGVSAVLNLVPAFKKASQAAEEHTVAVDKLQETERQYMVASAERSKQRAELEDEARNSMNLSTDERIAKMNEALELERKDMEERRNIAKQKLQNAEYEAKRIGDTSDATMDRIAQLRADYINTETEFIEGTRRTRRALKSFQDELKREEEAEKNERIQRWKEAAAARKEAADKEVAELRRVNEIAITFIKDESARARAELVNRHKVEIEDLQKRLDEEKNLTTQARTAIQAQIILLERKFAQDLDALDEENLKKRLEKETEIREQYIDERINAIKDETEREVAASNEGYQRRIDALVERLQTEKDLTEQAQKDINDTITLLYEQQTAKEAEIRKNAAEESLRQIFEETTLKAENVMNEALLKAGENGTEAARIQLDYAQSFLQRLQEMNEETYIAMYGSADAYKQAVLEAQRQVAEAQKSQLETVQQQATDTESTLHAVTGAMSDLFGAAAKDTEEYERFKKAMAIVDATISLGTAIAKATTISMEGDPYTVALRIASNVAAVVSAFASVLSTIRAVSIPSAGSFASGGIVEGDTGATDALTANVTRGEMILTKQDQLRLLDLIRAGVPSTVYDYKAMAEAMGEALKNMPAPVLDYAQFVSFQRRAAATERMVTIK